MVIDILAGRDGGIDLGSMDHATVLGGELGMGNRPIDCRWGIMSR